jgi:hypothetical protein
MIMFKYLISLPERSVRASIAALGGVVFEVTKFVTPNFLKQSRVYKNLIEKTFRITIELFGGVEELFPKEEVGVKETLFRKTAGNVIEIAGVLAFRISPVWLFAAASDILGGSKEFLREVVKELKEKGVIEPNAQFDSVEELLTYLENNSGGFADIVDMPPLNIKDMRKSYEQVKQNASTLPDLKQIHILYQQLNQTSQKEKRSIMEISTIMAGSAKKAGFTLGQKHILDYYLQEMTNLQQEGLVPFIRRSYSPYLTAVKKHLDPKTLTLTEKVLFRKRKELLQENNTTQKKL